MANTKDFVKSELESNCFSLLIDKYNNNIELEESGISSSEDCNSDILFILLQCIRNIEIFNEGQVTNIVNYVNRIGYGQ